MRVLGFCEGTRQDSGGVGLVGVPGIHRALAERGHHDALAIGGRPMSSARAVLTKRLEDVFDACETSSAGVVTFEAFGRWCFAPRLYAAAANVASRADFITMHSVFSYPVLVGYLLARRYRKPYGLWPHGVFAPVQRQISRRKKAVYDLLVARRILESASVLFFSAKGEREEALALGLNVPSVVIPHGINADQFALLPSRGGFRFKYLNGHAGPVVLYLGRLNAKKGIDLLVDAMAHVVREIPRVRLVIAGGGHPPTFAAEVKRWLRDAGLADVAIMTGMLHDADKMGAFADCDVFVLPSVAENFGFSLFEAMASRRAIVCSDTVNYAGEVRSWDAGLVVPRTPTAFAEAIVTLLRNPDLRERLAKNGLALARNYSWESCGRRLETAIQCILARQAFPASLDPAS